MICGLIIIAPAALVRKSSEFVVVSLPGTVFDPSVLLPAVPPKNPPEASVNVSFAFRKFRDIWALLDIVSELMVLPPVGSVSLEAIPTLSVEVAPEMLPVNSDAPGSIRIPLESYVAKPQFGLSRPYGSAPDTVAQPPMIPLVSVGALVNFTNGLSPIAPAGDKNVTVEPVERVIEFRFMVAVPMPELPTFTRNTLAPPASVRLPKVIVPSVPLRLM